MSQWPSNRGATRCAEGSKKDRRKGANIIETDLAQAK
jgi:hypothetical protein